MFRDRRSKSRAIDRFPPRQFAAKQTMSAGLPVQSSAAYKRDAMAIRPHDTVRHQANAM